MRRILRLFCLCVLFLSFHGQASMMYWLYGSKIGSSQYWVYGSQPGSKHFWEYGSGPGSRQHWIYGTSAGSEKYWLSSNDVGSKHYWEYGSGPGSRHYWINGKGPGSLYFWNYGHKSSFGPIFVSLCNGAKIDIEPCHMMVQNPENLLKVLNSQAEKVETPIICPETFEYIPPNDKKAGN